jgi:hypothetical protein
MVISRSIDNLMANIERDSCRFKAIQGADGKFVVRMEMFHKTVSALADATVDFELLNGSTQDQARKLAESMNDRVTGVLISKP